MLFTILYYINILYKGINHFRDIDIVSDFLFFYFALAGFYFTKKSLYFGVSIRSRTLACSENSKSFIRYATYSFLNFFFLNLVYYIKPEVTCLSCKGYNWYSIPFHPLSSLLHVTPYFN